MMIVLGHNILFLSIRLSSATPISEYITMPALSLGQARCDTSDLAKAVPAP